MKARIVTCDLKPAKTLEDFWLHCAALEWSLAEPIVIAAECIKSRVDRKDRVKPFHHQVQNPMRFCRRSPSACERILVLTLPTDVMTIE